MDRIVSSQNLKTTSDIVAAKEKQDHHDYQTIISKKTGINYCCCDEYFIYLT